MRRWLAPVKSLCSAASKGAYSRPPWPLAHLAVRAYGTNLTFPTVLSDEMKSKGFVNATPNFGGDLFSDKISSETSTADAGLPTDLVTVNAENVHFTRDMYGPWLVMTDDLQGELFVDHDTFVFYRPANGLGYGVGKLDVLDARQAGTAFTLKLETYTYQPTTSFAPRAGVTLEVTGMVKKVSSATSNYQTFSLIGIFRKEDPNRQSSESDSMDEQTAATGEDLVTGQFNAAKLSPWTPTEKDLPWQPNKELQRVFQEVFPQHLKLTSHVQRREEQAKASLIDAKGMPHAKHQAFHVDLERYRIGTVPDMYYIPNYVNEDEEAQILSLVKNTPSELKSKLAKRTVQEWGCTMCEECEKSFVSDANMPPWVQECTDMLLYDGIFTPSTFLNSVRIHEYEKGEGIGPHCDGPIYVPCVTVLSLASTSVMSFYPKQAPHLDQPMEHYNDTFKFSEGAIGAQTPVMTVVMEPRSLLIFADTAYYYYPHGVSDKDVDDLSVEAAGEVINRQFLRDKDVTAVERKYRVSITTRNLLTRCNHQPARAEYNMKRAWYLYHQLPLPEPLFKAPPVHSSAAAAAVTTQPNGTGAPAQKSDAAGVVGGGSGLSSAQLSDWERKMDRLFANQEEIKKSLRELNEVVTLTVSAEAQFRKDLSSILNNLTSTVLDVDAKVEDLQDDLQVLTKRE